MMKVKQLTVNPFQENTYVVWDDATLEAAIIDCGALFPGEKERIAAFIEDNRLTVTCLLNTHLHLDHSFGNVWAAERYAAPLMAHLGDEELGMQIGAQAQRFGLPIEVKAKKIDTYLADGDVVRIGDHRLQVIHTPGHTPGGVCFYSTESKVLFSGDTLFEGSIGRTDLDGGSYGALIGAVKNRLMTLPDDTVVNCGHGPSTSIGFERKNNPFL